MKSFFAGFLVIAVTCGTSVAAPRQQLAGHVPKAVAGLASTGQLPGETQLKLAIGVPLRNQEALNDLMKALYDPASPQYRHYLTPDQFTEKFGATQDEYAAVVNFAKTNGFTVTATHSDRMLLEVTAKVSDIERAFQVTMRTYPHPKEARSFYAPDAEPSIPSDVAIADISGLNNYAYPHPKNFKRRPLGKQQFAKDTSMDGSGPSGSLIGPDFRNAYAPGVTNTGAGQVLGLFEFDNYYTGDVASYATAASGLATVPPVTTVLLGGFNGTPGIEDSEVALDIEMAMSMAPGLKEIVSFETDTNVAANVVLSVMATNTAINQFSCSWNFNNVSNPRSTMDGYFMKFISQGQSFFNSSGDYGSDSGPVTAPDDDPYLTLVGGTTLFTSGNGGSWLAETAWNTGYDIGYTNADGVFVVYAVASSGGISTTYSIPPWQAGVSGNGNGASTSFRNIPDVAMAADNIFLVADDGEAELGVGTSCSAPLWAAFTALANQEAQALGKAPVGFINETIYPLYKTTNYASTFDDITMGNNTNGDTGFYATTGYDLCTGLGSPTGSSLIIALAAPDGFVITPGRGFTANGPVGGPFNITTQTLYLTNTGASSLKWSLGGVPAWLNVGSSGGTLTSGGEASVTVSLNAAANAQAAGVYVANLWFTNTTSGLAQLRQVTLQVNQNLVHDGSFESGDFCYWSLTGLDAPFYNFVDNGYTTPYSPPTAQLDDNFFAAFGETGAVAYLSQPLLTRSGQTYNISFWWANPSGLYPSQLIVQFGTNVLYNQSNLPATPFVDSGNFTIPTFQNMQFSAVATSNTTLLQFGGRQDQDFLLLDDVSVVPVGVPVIPAPTIQSIQRTAQTIEITWTSVSGQVYQVQTATSLNQTNWSALGANITATGTTTTSPAEPIGTSSTDGFYRVALIP